MSTSTKQRLNTISSTDTELVAADDLMPHMCWTNYFLEFQGYNINSTIMYQDKQSAIILNNNGRASSSKRTKHLNIRYSFITDRIKKGDLHIEYCLTNNMVANFFTKPLQGKKFLQFRKVIMNLQDWNLPWPKECVGNQPISYYINGPMFGFQSLLYTVCYRIHKGFIWTSTLRILVSLFDIPSLFDTSSLIDIFLILSPMYWLVCLQGRENYLQLSFNLFHP